MEYKICTLCKESLPISDFYTNGKTPKGTQKYKGKCKACEIEYNKKRFLTKLTSILDHPLECQVCGYSKYFGALEFHHLDGSTKEYSISKITNYSEDRLRSEVAKCVLLCANCHREVHAGELELS